MKLNKKSIESINVSGKKVICRVDYNVPLNENLEITDDLRIKSSFKTINYLLDNNAAVILMSHLGRPKGRVVENLRLKPIFEYLKEHLQHPCYYVRDCIGPEVDKKAKELKPGEVLLLENLRFYPEEEANDPEFAKKLASLADIYVNDAFGTAHRAHASTEGITKFMEVSVAGYLMMKEINYLIKAIEFPQRPLTAVIGGKKVSDKIKVLKRLVEKCDNILIGGGMAYTFFKAKGIPIGDSILDQNGLEVAKEVLKTAEHKKKNLILPVDIVIADKFSDEANTKLIDIEDGIPDGWQGLDIGDKTIELFSKILEETKMLIWNGPVGVFELKKFSRGTKELIKFIAEHSMISIIGGGDTASAIEHFGYSSEMTHISTGGGASLELLEGKELPGIAALDDLN
jgi:3-phosphoglycerate kinase